MGSVKMQDVAQEAGVSRTTASLVLSGKAFSISEATRQRVLTAAEAIGYRHNRLAANLRREHSRMLGLVIFGIENPYYTWFMTTAEQAAHEAGYELFLDATADYTHTGLRSKLAGWPVAGVLMWSHDRDYLAQIVGAKGADILPVVKLSNGQNDSDSVLADFRGGVTDAMNHLRERGYAPIHYLLPDTVQNTDEVRYQTYRELALTWYQELHLLCVGSNFDRLGRQYGREVGLQIANLPPAKRPRAVLCHNDILAIGLVHGLRRGRLRVPQDVAVVGFDGIAEGQELDTPLTTLITPMESLCRESVQMLIRRIQVQQSDEDLPPQRLILPVHLQVGETT